MAMLAVTTLIAASIWLVALERVRHERAITIAAEVQKNSNLTESQKERAERSFLVLDQILLFLRAEYASQGLPKSLDARLAAIQADRRYLRAVSLIDARGDVMSATYDASSILTANHADRGYFIHHASTRADTLLIGVPFVDKRTGVTAMALTRRLSNADGSFAGVALILLDPAYFATSYVKTMQGPLDSMALLGFDGFIRARRTGDKLSFGEDNRSSQVYKEISRAPNGSYIAVSPSDGTQRIVVYRSLEQYPMIIAVGSSLEDALQPVQERERTYLGAAAASTLALMLVLGAGLLLMARRARVAAAIEASERQFRLLFETSIDAVISIRPDGRVMAANPAACAMFGREAGELQSLDAVQLFDPADPRMSLWRDPKALPESLRGQVSMVRGDGSRFEAEVSGSLHSRGSALRSMIIRDISERRQAELERASLEAQLRESQKMQAIGTLAGGIAHDFNNILANILGNSELARQDLRTNPAAALESVEEIRKAATRARDLVRQILSFSRRQPAERKTIALGPVVEESARLLRATLPSRFVLVARCDADVPLVLADATQIEQVVLNLVTNSMQAMPREQGEITISLDTVVLDEALALARPALKELHQRQPGRTVRLSVRDSGPGMDPATVERIFEPFFTTKPHGEGTGLGLSVVLGIVQGHEGAILVESSPGIGTTFELYFPAATAAVTTAAPLMPVAGAPVPAPTVAMQILYLDDDEALVFLVKRLLERNGFRVCAYTRQHEALDALAEAPDAFDLVITDYNMPGMSGLDVARKVQGIRADLPIAVTSGFIDDALRAKAEEAGVCELIFKATDVNVFCAVVQRLAMAVPAKAA